MGTPEKQFIIETVGSGVALLDYDNDGWLDIYLVNGSTYDAESGKTTPPHAALFHNNHASGHYALGMSFSALQHTQEAAVEFERSISLLPAQTESYFRLGLLRLDAKDLDPAEGHFRHVLSRDPKHAGALAALGRVELERRQYGEAATLLQSAVTSNSSLREAHYYLGLTYARMGRKAESDQQLQIAAGLDQEEAAKQRTVFTILDTGQSNAPGSDETLPPEK